MSSQNHQPLTLGHVVTVCHPSNGRRRELPPLTIGGLALELAGMIRDALPDAMVCIVRVGLRPTDLEQAEKQTHAIKRQVIEVREAEHPGHAFLAATGFWPTAKQE